MQGPLLVLPGTARLGLDDRCTPTLICSFRRLGRYIRKSVKLKMCESQ